MAAGELHGDAGEERTLRSADGVSISAVHVRARESASKSRGMCFIVVHGFTGHWRQERVQRVISRFTAFGAVVALDMRGHGASGGATTVGDEEVLDVAAAVEWARELGYDKVVTVGFSLGGAVVLREAALLADGPARVDAVVSVSAPAFWFYRGTRIMRVAHWMVETVPGRAVMRLRRTRISSQPWRQPYPVQPFEAAAQLAGMPLLVVHGDADHYFPLEHPETIITAATGVASRADLWIEAGMGHAEAAVSESTLDRIAHWALDACSDGQDISTTTDQQGSE